jgi:surface polysaccharide O-acyltransferase-like enzyme
MTAIVYFGEMLVVSIFAIVLLVVLPLEIGSAATVFVCGVVSWTLAEYAVHRLVLHGLAPREHGLHHANPDEAVLTVF